ncbi:MAG: 30S ribosomal protein S16 [Thermostichales cyanobacterium SZTDM-1c_bins_54]
MVKLRLKRYGKKREATYRIVAIESHARREGRPLQEVGFYNPRTKATSLKTAEILSWLRKGAQPTDTVRYIFNKAKIYDMLAAGVTGSPEPLITVVAESKAQPTPVATAVAEATAQEPEAEAAVAAVREEKPN